MTPQLTRARHPSRAGVDPGLRHGEPTPRVLLKPPASAATTNNTSTAVDLLQTGIRRRRERRRRTTTTRRWAGHPTSPD